MEQPTIKSQWIEIHEVLQESSLGGYLISICPPNGLSGLIPQSWFPPDMIEFSTNAQGKRTFRTSVKCMATRNWYTEAEYQAGINYYSHG